ncbi:hypothetical protein HPB51_019646 [Rhipicephalus microplus]|uniref:Uncharacterized protein n=1 Tax=Rhipicephalus microplus TaxID=6941 RepID=A0A9J6EC25_RHIMP|nr:hypothetical protein HPB51_019646 [Rhipicephalus microplus]
MLRTFRETSCLASLDTAADILFPLQPETARFLTCARVATNLPRTFISSLKFFPDENGRLPRKFSEIHAALAHYVKLRLVHRPNVNGAPLKPEERTRKLQVMPAVWTQFLLRALTDHQRQLDRVLQFTVDSSPRTSAGPPFFTECLVIRQQVRQGFPELARMRKERTSKCYRRVSLTQGSIHAPDKRKYRPQSISPSLFSSSLDELYTAGGRREQMVERERGVPGPPDAASREDTGRLEGERDEPKASRLWSFSTCGGQAVVEVPLLYKEAL